MLRIYFKTLALAALMIAGGVWSGSGNAAPPPDDNRHPGSEHPRPELRRFDGHMRDRDRDRHRGFFFDGFPWYYPYDVYYPPEQSYVPNEVEPRYVIIPPAYPDVAYMDVMVQTPDTKVWVNGVKIAGEGMNRHIMSPVLMPGQDYSYVVQAQWSKDGQMVTQVKEVRIRAGERRQVSF